MGWIITSIALIVGCVVWLYFVNKDSNFAVFLCAIGLLILLISIASWAGNGADERGFERDYQILTEELEVYHSCTNPKVGYHYLSKLEKDIEKINDKIQSNQEDCGTFWWGLYSSSKIAKSKPFNIKKELGQ